MVSRKFNEVFKPNPTSEGLIHFDVNLKQVRPRELSFFITNPNKSPRLQTLPIGDKEEKILTLDEGSIASDQDGNLVFSGKHRFLERHAPSDGRYKIRQKINP